MCQHHQMSVWILINYWWCQNESIPSYGSLMVADEFLMFWFLRSLWKDTILGQRGQPLYLNLPLIWSDCSHQTRSQEVKSLGGVRDGWAFIYWMMNDRGRKKRPGVAWTMRPKRDKMREGRGSSVVTYTGVLPMTNLIELNFLVFLTSLHLPAFVLPLVGFLDPYFSSHCSNYTCLKDIDLSAQPLY